MGLLKKKKALNVLKSIGLGLLDTVLPVKGIIGGIIKGASEVVTANKEAKLGGKDQIDYLRLSVALSTLALIIAFIAGWITFEDLKSVLRLLN